MLPMESPPRAGTPYRLRKTLDRVSDAPLTWGSLALLLLHSLVWTAELANGSGEGFRLDPRGASLGGLLAFGFSHFGTAHFFFVALMLVAIVPLVEQRAGVVMAVAMHLAAGVLGGAAFLFAGTFVPGLLPAAGASVPVAALLGAAMWIHLTPGEPRPRLVLPFVGPREAGDAEILPLVGIFGIFCAAAAASGHYPGFEWTLAAIHGAFFLGGMVATAIGLTIASAAGASPPEVERRPEEARPASPASFAVAPRKAIDRESPRVAELRAALDACDARGAWNAWWRVVDVHPDMPIDLDLEWRLAQLLLAEPMPDEAMRCLKRILRIHPYGACSAYAQYELGLLHAERAKERPEARDEAIDYLTRSLAPPASDHAPSGAASNLRRPLGAPARRHALEKLADLGVRDYVFGGAGTVKDRVRSSHATAAGPRPSSAGEELRQAFARPAVTQPAFGEAGALPVFDVDASQDAGRGAGDDYDSFPLMDESPPSRSAPAPPSLPAGRKSGESMFGGFDSSGVFLPPEWDEAEGPEEPAKPRARLEVEDSALDAPVRLGDSSSGGGPRVAPPPLPESMRKPPAPAGGDFGPGPSLGREPAPRAGGASPQRGGHPPPPDIWGDFLGAGPPAGVKPKVVVPPKPSLEFEIPIPLGIDSPPASAPPVPPPATPHPSPATPAVRPPSPTPRDPFVEAPRSISADSRPISLEDLEADAPPFGRGIAAPEEPTPRIGSLPSVPRKSGAPASPSPPAGGEIPHARSAPSASGAPPDRMILGEAEFKFSGLDQLQTQSVVLLRDSKDRTPLYHPDHAYSVVVPPGSAVRVESCVSILGEQLRMSPFGVLHAIKKRHGILASEMGVAEAEHLARRLSEAGQDAMMVEHDARLRFAGPFDAFRMRWDDERARFSIEGRTIERPWKELLAVGCGRVTLGADAAPRSVIDLWFGSPGLRILLWSATLESAEPLVARRGDDPKSFHELGREIHRRAGEALRTAPFFQWMDRADDPPPAEFAGFVEYEDHGLWYLLAHLGRFKSFPAKSK